LSVVFLSRISPVKNLGYFLDILNGCNLRIKFDIYGPIGDQSYWVSCTKKIKKLPENIELNYLGAVPHERVMATISEYNLFVLPTLGENFGHVIIEALTLGIPVLLSDRTPWTSIVNNSGYAAISLVYKEKYLEFLEYLYRMSSDDYACFRKKAFKALDVYLKDADQTNRYITLFE